MTSDLELLKNYTRNRCEESFATLVNRHLNLVYSAALRQVRSPQLAEEVAQSTFTDLANQAHRLAPDTILTAWLYQVAHHTAINVVRREARRQLREQIACELTAMNSAADWSHIEPLLDEAMLALDNTDRAAVLLRYFENKSLREVGQTLGVSDDAAQKRVSRAVERLREFFNKHGLTVGASTLILVISANAIQAAPVGLAATISSLAAASTAKSAGTLTLLKAMAMSKLKIGVISAVVVASAVTTTIIYHHDQTLIRDANAKLQQQKEQLAQYQAEQKRLSNLLSLANSPRSNNSEELERLRNEAVRLRKQAEELATLKKQEQQLQATLTKAWQDLRTSDTNQQQTENSEELSAKVHYSMGLTLAMWEYASRHQSRFPTNLQEVVQFLPAEAKNQTNLAPNQFEIVYHGSAKGVAKYAHSDRIILVKERQPWKNSDGKWVMAWSDLHGAGYVYSPADGNFDTWVKQHSISSEAQTE